MPKSSITAVALVAFLAGALSPSADAFVPRQMSVARSAATCESAFCFQFEFLHGPAAFLECSTGFFVRNIIVHVQGLKIFFCAGIHLFGMETWNQVIFFCAPRTTGQKNDGHNVSPGLSMTRIMLRSCFLLIDPTNDSCCRFAISPLFSNRCKILYVSCVLTHSLHVDQGE